MNDEDDDGQPEIDENMLLQVICISIERMRELTGAMDDEAALEKFEPFIACGITTALAHVIRPYRSHDANSFANWTAEMVMRLYDLARRVVDGTATEGDVAGEIEDSYRYYIEDDDPINGFMTAVLAGYWSLLDVETDDKPHINGPASARQRIAQRVLIDVVPHVEEIMALNGILSADGEDDPAVRQWMIYIEAAYLTLFELMSIFSNRFVAFESRRTIMIQMMYIDIALYAHESVVHLLRLARSMYQGQPTETMINEMFLNALR